MTIAIGKKAPDFTLDATGGETITLSALKGRPVVVYFYPKDDTPGCTAQACGFRDTLGELQKMDVAVIGVSKDSVASHEKFTKKFELNFPLASDTDGTVCEAYGTWIEKSMYGRKYMGIDRATFLIDAEGKVAQIWRKVSVPGHIAEVAKAINDLRKQDTAAAETPAATTIKKPAVKKPAVPKKTMAKTTKSKSFPKKHHNEFA